MASWNSNTREDDQPPMPAYSYISTSNSQYQPPIVPSNYAPATGYGTISQSGYIPTSGNGQAPISAGLYSNSTAYNTNMAQAGLQQPTPGSLAALEQNYSQQQRSSQSQDMAMLSAPTFNVQPPQPYLNSNIDTGFYNMTTPMMVPVTSTSNNTLGYSPNFPLIDQNMLAAGPPSAYSTPPTFYDSDAAWSFDSSGQEVQSSSSSTRASGSQVIRRTSPQAASQAPTISEATYDCPVEGCNKTFNRSYNYRAHMETHSANRVYPFECPVENCDKRFRRKTDLQRHHLSVHEKARDHQCEFCGRYFSRKDTLRRHIDDGCSRRFETSFDLSVGPSKNGDGET